MNALALTFVTLADKVPTDNNVKAGWPAFFIFVGLCVAVGLLGWSLTRHLRRAETNAEEGAFDPSDKKPRRTTI